MYYLLFCFVVAFVFWIHEIHGGQFEIIDKILTPPENFFLLIFDGFAG